MTVSHKRTFFENIPAYDERQIIREVRRLLANNRSENKRFDVVAFRRKLSHHLPADRVERVMEAAMIPYVEEPKAEVRHVTGADLARSQRKVTKRNMRSRRQSR